MITIGLLGAGFMAETHAAAYAQLPEARLAGVVAIHPARAQHLADRYDARAYASLSAMLADDTIDAIDICVPTDVHESAVISVARAGKHLICEKPLTLTLDAADRMLAAVDAAGIIAMIGHVLRFWPEYREIQSLLATGQLGHPLSASAHRLTTTPAWADWFRDPARSGGAALDLQIHDLDVLYHLFGMPDRVYAAGSRSAQGSWDHTFSTLSFGTLQATVESSYLLPASYPFSAGLRVVGSKASVEYRFRVHGQVDQRASAHTELMLYPIDDIPRAIPVVQYDAYVAELRYFISCIQRRESPTQATLAEARDVLQIALALGESLESGQALVVNPSSGGK
jgi:predicted dehydrogenase